LEANPQDASALHGLALIAARELNLNLANEFMDKALKLVPQNAEYLADMGDIALRRRKPQEAIDYYLKSRSKDKGLSATLGLARANELLKKDKEAASFYDEAVEMAGDDYPEAQELAGRFFGRYGQMAKGHYLLSRYFGNVGQLKQAIFHCQTAMREAAGGRYKISCEQNIRDFEEIMKESKG
jgi:predicted Zn-dependent protease